MIRKCSIFIAIFVAFTFAIKATADEDLINASVYGDVAKAKAALKAGANPNARGFAETTPLMHAAIGNHVELVKILIDAKADIHAINAGKLSALGYAELHKHEAVIKILTGAGAKRPLNSGLSATSKPAREKTGNADFELFMKKCVSQYGIEKEAKCEKLGICIITEAPKIPAPYCQTVTDCSNLLTNESRRTVRNCRQREGLAVGNRVGDTESAAELLVGQSLAPRIESHMKSWGSGAGGCTWRKDTQSYWCK